MKVVDLKKALSERGLETTGLKAVLVQRLTDAIAADTKVEETSPEVPASEEKTEPATPAKEESEAPATEEPAEPEDAAAAILAAKKRRAERFGIPLQQSQEEKLALRAARFGTVTKEASKKLKKTTPKRKGAPVIPLETLVKRAKKFGLPMPKGYVDPEEQQRREARALRFAPKPAAAETTTPSEATA
jgi:hypothetical protein